VAVPDCLGGSSGPWEGYLRDPGTPGPRDPGTPDQGSGGNPPPEVPKTSTGLPRPRGRAPEGLM